MSSETMAGIIAKRRTATRLKVLFLLPFLSRHWRTSKPLSINHIQACVCRVLVSVSLLNISEREWQAMVADFRKSLNKFKVPRAEQNELIALVDTTKNDIVARAR